MAYAVAVVCTLVLVAAWAIVMPYVPNGWLTVTVDVSGYMLSIIVMAGGYSQLKRAVRPFHSFLLTAAIWGVIVFPFRALLGAIAG